MNFNLSNEIYEELTSNKYPTLFEIEIGEKEKIKVVRYEDYKKLENIIKEVREYIQDRYDGEVLTHTFDKDNVKELLEILDKGENNVEI